MHTKTTQQMWVAALFAVSLLSTGITQAKSEYLNKNAAFQGHHERGEGHWKQRFFGIEPASREQRMVARMTEKLALTDAQQTQIKSLMEERRQARQAEREKFQASMKTILTAEQLQKLAN